VPNHPALFLVLYGVDEEAEAVADADAVVVGVVVGELLADGDALAVGEVFLVGVVVGFADFFGFGGTKELDDGVGFTATRLDVGVGCGGAVATPRDGETVGELLTDGEVVLLAFPLTWPARWPLRYRPITTARAQRHAVAVAAIVRLRRVAARSGPPIRPPGPPIRPPGPPGLPARPPVAASLPSKVPVAAAGMSARVRPA
jgi:hypothetical protein